MTERKLISAFITSLAAFFIVPLLYNNYQDGFMISAMQMSVITFPVIFTYGLIVSYISDTIAASKLNISGVSFLYHSFLGAGFAILVFLFTWVNSNRETTLQPELLTAGFTLGAIFFIVDDLLKYFGNYLKVKNEA
ncbi:MAG: hypothetical protein KBT36_05340 [Kurthia sp.]|nr:hypothetical protein [Candidatus Kurthia equi]